jgi:hypothetical protein
MRSGFTQHVTPLMTPDHKGGLPLTTSPTRLFARMNDQMRGDQIRAAAETLRNTISLEYIIALAASHEDRMKLTEMEGTRSEFRAVALEAQIETAFKELKAQGDFCDGHLAQFTTTLNSLVADLSAIAPKLDLVKISQAIDEFHTIYEAHDLVFTPMTVAF